jgi:hypothetical protein
MDFTEALKRMNLKNSTFKINHDYKSYLHYIFVNDNQRTRFTNKLI